MHRKTKLKPRTSTLKQSFPHELIQDLNLQEAYATLFQRVVCVVSVRCCTCPLLLDGRHLVLSEVPVLCQSLPVSLLQELVRQVPGHGAELPGLMAMVEFEREWIFAVNTFIKLSVGLKGQLNRVSRLIKATGLREHTGRGYWKDTHMND